MEVLYFNFMPHFMDSHFAAQIHKVQSSGLDPATTASQVAAIQRSQQLYQPPSELISCSLRVAAERNKVDGSQTPCPGRESDHELSGAGWRADLYSAFGVQRNLGDLHLNKLESCFSATGRRGRIMKIPGKSDDSWPSTSYFSDNED